MNEVNRPMTWITQLASAALTLAILGSTAHAEVAIFDKDDWKANLYGFIEFDGMYDSKGTLLESPGSAAIPLPSSYFGNNGKTTMSMRNTRFGFNVTAPVVDDLKTRAVFEMDFLGFDPGISTANPSNSESGFFNNSTMRMRHAFVSASKENWQVLIGQTWSVFGWQPYNFLTTSTVNPTPGMIFQRESQITYMHTCKGESTELKSAISLSRPPSRASGTPAVDAGVRFTTNGRKAGFASNNGDIKVVGTSVGLSGTYRQLTFPGVPANPNSSESAAGYGASLDIIVPILTVDDKDNTAGTLTFTTELASGRGIGDHVGGFTGNLAGTSNATTATGPDVDAGIAAQDAGLHFQPIDLLVYNAQLQYHLPGDAHAWVDVGYGQTFSDNVAALKAPAPGTVAYNRAEILFANFFHDFTKQLRGSLGYEQFTTGYVDSESAIDSRYIMTAYYRF